MKTKTLDLLEELVNDITLGNSDHADALSELIALARTLRVSADGEIIDGADRQVYYIKDGRVVPDSTFRMFNTYYDAKPVTECYVSKIAAEAALAASAARGGGKGK